MRGPIGKVVRTLPALVALMVVAAPADAQWFRRKTSDCAAPTPCAAPTWPAPYLPESKPEPKPKPKPEPRPTPIPEPTPSPTAPPSPPTEPTTAPEDSGETLAMFDSSVGYIDSAIVGNQLRIRYDIAYNSNRPNRAEYFYANGAPSGPGLPAPESRVDYQIIESYLEYAFRPNFSGFLIAPVRFLDPQINDTEDGFGDMLAGFKYAFLNDANTVGTFQLKTYIPTGDSTRGLGTNHVSLEPGLLLYRKLSDLVRCEGELRYWIPVGGTDFAGSLFEYGVGFSYGRKSADQWWITPVVEMVGWTVLSGKETDLSFVGAAPVIEDAAGDTIVNAKGGVRVGCGNRANFYFGYGRALTGDVWYKDLYRAEFRLFY